MGDLRRKKLSQPPLKKNKKRRQSNHQVGAAAWSLAVVATLLGLSHPAVDKVREKRERERGRERLARVNSFLTSS